MVQFLLAAHELKKCTHIEAAVADSASCSMQCSGVLWTNLNRLTHILAARRREIHSHNQMREFGRRSSSFITKQSFKLHSTSSAVTSRHMPVLAVINEIKRRKDKEMQEKKMVEDWEKEL